MSHSGRKTLHWVCPAPSPYHTHLFRALAQAPDFDLCVHFVDASFPEHPWRSHDLRGFRSRVFDRRLGIDWTLVRIALLDRSAMLFLPGWYDPTSRLVAAIGRAPFAIWTDTPALHVGRPALKDALRGAFIRHAFRRARFVVGTGRPGVEALRRMGAPPEKLRSLPFFVPTAEPVRREHDITRFCSLGRLTNALKGFDVALAALARARAATGSERFHYMIAGVGPDEGRLRQQAKELGIAHLVTFAGWLEPGDTTALLRRSHAMLHPARHDPFPVSVLEAMANGLGIFGSDTSGSVVDRITDGVNGFVHPTGDVEALAHQLMPFLDRPEQLAGIGEAARRTAEEWPASRGVEIVRSMLMSASPDP